MLKKFIEYATGNFLALLLGFFSSPIITRIISPEELGKFSLFNTATSLLFLVMMCGTDQSYVRYYNSEDEDGKKNLLHVCTWISLLIGSGASIGLMCFNSQVSEFILGEESLFVVVLLILNIFSNILQRFTILEVRMSMKAKLYSAMNVWHKLSYILLVFAIYIYLKNNKSTALMLATVGSNVLGFAGCMIIDRKAWFSRRISKAKVKIPELIKYGFPFVFVSAINWIFEYMDRISIRYYCDFSELGIYTAASTIVALLTACQNAFAAFWVPVAYSKYEEDPNCNEFFIKMNRIVSFVMLIGAIGMVAGKDLIIYLLGSDYRQAMYIFPFLTFMPVMYTISETTVMGINFKKKTYMHIVIASVAALVNLIGNTILVPRIGARGAAISTGLSYIVLFAIRTIIASKLYPVKYRVYSLIVGVFLLCILATYSSFHAFDACIVAMAVFSLLIICIVYRDVIEECVRKIRRK